MVTRIDLQQWERRAEWPLAGLALVFLAAYSVEVLRNEIRELRQQLRESGMIRR
jgi:hypothetical protein